MNRTIVRGRLLIDGTGRPPIPKGAVLIEGDQIAAVGTEAAIGPVAGATVVDRGEEVLVPGLIDCHNHLTLTPSLDNYPARLLDSDIELTLRATANMLIDLRSGVTTARCLGDRNFIDVACKQGVQAGLLRGPRLLIATRGIRATHGHGFVGYPFDGADQIRRAVRENLKAGADVIKLFVTGTVRGTGEIPCYLSPEEIATAVREAHNVGIQTTVHCIGGSGLDECLKAGIDCIEHGYFATDRQIDLLAESGRWLVLTPSPFFSEERIRTLPQGHAEGFRRGREEVAERMAAVIESGVHFAVGTDAMHGGLARELEYLTELGLSSMGALLAVTRDAAQVCGLTESIGTLEPGKIADIVGLKGNPLEDIHAVGRVGSVIQSGRLLFPETGVQP